MKTIVRVLAIAASAAVATTAIAGDRLSDSAYLKAARCQGLAHAAALGPVDTSGIDALMAANAENRDVRLRNEAKVVRADAKAAAERPGARARLTKERDTRCTAWVSSTALANNAGAVAAR